MVVNSQNALYNLIRMGLSNCDGGMGYRWGNGQFSECGNRDGERTVSFEASRESPVVGESILHSLFSFYCIFSTPQDTLTTPPLAIYHQAPMLLDNLQLS